MDKATRDLMSEAELDLLRSASPKRLERLASAARVNTGGKRRSSSKSATVQTKPREHGRRDHRPPIKERQTASARAQGRRSQAKRDSR